MSYQATVVEVFLSSPGDVLPERQLILSFAAEWNRIRSRETGCFISILTWEEMVAPALGDRPQEVINRQIGNSYDVYLGVMWTRLGTFTGVADSGTVEEFDAALERARQGDRLRIATFFKKAPIDPETIDPTQLQKVRDFKERIGGQGVFYREFSDENALRSILNLLFEQIAKEKDAYSASEAANAETDTLAPKANAITESQEEVGLIEVGEKFEELSFEIVDKLKDLGEEEEKNTETLSSCVDSINMLASFPNQDASMVKGIIHKAARGLLNLAAYYDTAIDPIEDLLRQMSDLADADIRIRLDFDDPMTAAAGNIDAMKGLSATIGTSLLQLDDLIDSTSKLPRFSSEMAKAKNNLAKSRQRLRQLFASFKESLDSSIAFFEAQTRP